MLLKGRHSFVVALVCCATLQCATPHQPSVESGVALGNTHPLVGRIYGIDDGAFLDRKALIVRLSTTGILIVGEKHDNAAHHEIELGLLETLARERALKGVVLEMLSTDQQEALDRSRSLRGEDLKQAIGWDEGGWSWEAYGPIIEFVLDQPLRLVAGNPPKARVMSVVHGRGAPSEVSRLGPTEKQRLLKILAESHCGLMPVAHLEPMLHVQVLRDLQMQRSLTQEKDPGLRVLLTGNYHARGDFGVPVHLRAEVPDLPFQSIALVEVQEGKYSPIEYMEEGGGVGLYNFLWFTRAAPSRKDPCESIRERHRSKVLPPDSQGF